MFLRLHKKRKTKRNDDEMMTKFSEIKTKFSEIYLTGFVLPTKIRLSKNNFSE